MVYNTSVLKDLNIPVGAGLIKVRAISSDLSQVSWISWRSWPGSFLSRSPRKKSSCFNGLVQGYHCILCPPNSTGYKATPINEPYFF